jgi:hypothetical protein
MGKLPLPYAASGVTLGQAGAISDGDTAVAFDGVAGYANTNSWMSLAGDWTMECWAYLTNATVANYGVMGGGGGPLVRIMVNPTTIRPGVKPQGAPTEIWQAFPTASNVNTWVHMVFVRDSAAGTGTQYRNGVVIGTLTGIPTGVCSFQCIGAQGPGAYYFAGTIDETAVYNHALTAAQVQAHYNARTLTSAVAEQDGDYAIRTSDDELFERVSGVWVDQGTSIKGATGAQGPPGQGVPAGGASGTILTKTSAADYATAWNPAPVALPPGGAIGQSLTKKTAADGDAQWSTLDNLHYLGAYAAGSFVEGDMVVYQGISYVCVRPTSAAPVQWPMPPTSRPSYATTLPTAPYDGQEAILVDSITNPTYQWRFRYNASSTSAYKWEFVGGFPLQTGPMGSFSFNQNNAWVGMTGGPVLTVPRAGDYLVRYGASVYNNDGVASVYIIYTRAQNVGATVALPETQTRVSNYSGATAVSEGIFPSAAAGTQYQIAVVLQSGVTQTSYIINAWMDVIPRRVS